MADRTGRRNWLLEWRIATSDKAGWNPRLNSPGAIDARSCHIEEDAPEPADDLAQPVRQRLVASSLRRSDYSRLQLRLADSTSSNPRPLC
jgi:hypothetical protein